MHTWRMRLYASGRCRPSHPPSVVSALLLAQLFYGVSDREAERRSRFDMSWKAALGLALEHRGIPHVVLVEFRARLVREGMKLMALSPRRGTPSLLGVALVTSGAGVLHTRSLLSDQL